MDSTDFDYFVGFGGRSGPLGDGQETNGMEDDLDTAQIGKEAYPGDDKKREFKQKRKILGLQERLERCREDYSMIKEENDHLKSAAEFWRNKVNQIIQIQKMYFLEEIADDELNKMISSFGFINQSNSSKTLRFQIKNKPSSLNVGLDSLKSKEMESLNKKQKYQKNKEMRATQEPAQLNSIFKGHKNNSKNSNSVKKSVRFKDFPAGEQIEDSVTLITPKGSTSKKSKIIPNPSFLSKKTEVRHDKSQPKIKPRKKFEVELTEDHKILISKTEEINEIMDKVIEKGSQSLTKAELSIYKQISEGKLPVVKPVKKQSKRKKVKNQESSLPIANGVELELTAKQKN